MCLIFKKIFFLKIAKISKFTTEQMALYQESLNTYRDIHNVTETARIEGEIKGEIRGEIKGEIKTKNKGITKALLRGKLSIEEIAEIFDVSIDYVLDIQKKLPS